MTTETGARVATGAALVAGGTVLCLHLGSEPTSVRLLSPPDRSVETGSYSKPLRSADEHPSTDTALAPKPAPSHRTIPVQLTHRDPPSTSTSLAGDLVAAWRNADHANAAAVAIRVQEALLQDSAIMVDQLLAAFLAETDPLVLDQLAGLLATSPQALTDPALLATLERLACSDTQPARRAASISILGQCPAASDELISTISARARLDLDPVVRMAAVGALANLANRSPQRSAALNTQLLNLVPVEADPAVRGAALGALKSAALDPRRHTRLCAIMETDTHIGVRQVAAEVLGDVPPELRQTTLTRLESALARESDYHLRRTMLTAVVRAGRQEAIPAMRRLARGTDALATDAADYLAGLERGLVDMAKLWTFKQKLEQERGGPAAVPGGDHLVHHD